MGGGKSLRTIGNGWLWEKGVSDAVENLHISPGSGCEGMHMICACSIETKFLESSGDLGMTSHPAPIRVIGNFWLLREGKSFFSVGDTEDMEGVGERKPWSNHTVLYFSKKKEYSDKCIYQQQSTGKCQSKTM